MNDNRLNQETEYFAVRQPTFDRKECLWGYELFFHECNDTECRQAYHSDAAGLNTFFDGLPHLIQGIPPEVLISLNANLVLEFDGLVYLLLPPEHSKSR
ncbi:MAG: hypothetical protein V3571_11765 [Pseudodesulfovibrio sp.]